MSFDVSPVDWSDEWVQNQLKRNKIKDLNIKPNNMTKCKDGGPFKVLIIPYGVSFKDLTEVEIKRHIEQQSIIVVDDLPSKRPLNITGVIKPPSDKECAALNKLIKPVELIPVSLDGKANRRLKRNKNGRK